MATDRILKFRAWDKGHKKMSYKVNLYSMNSSGKIDRAQIDMKQIMNIVGFDCYVMQYTGLKDKNGKEIYEGDIVEMPFYGITVIVWNENISSFQYSYHAVAGKGVTNTLYNHDSNKYEVIGNIYENPELTEK